jgi:hypothetical protein
MLFLLVKQFLYGYVSSIFVGRFLRGRFLRTTYGFFMSTDVELLRYFQGIAHSPVKCSEC